MTLSQLKKDAATGKMFLTLIERFGKTGSDIPERLQGTRRVIGHNTVALKIENLNGQISEMRFDRASLIEYTGNTLTIYNPGYRDLNEHEKAVLREADRVKAEYNAKYPYNDAYWAVRDFITKSDCPYLTGGEFKKGKRYDYKGIMDKDIKGEAILKYQVTREGGAA